MSLIKSKLIQNITEANPHLFVRDVERIVNTIFNEITQSLSEGKRVELRGFGAFSVRERNPIRGRNPKSGEAIELDSRSLIYFRPSKLIKNRINKLTS